MAPDDDDDDDNDNSYVRYLPGTTENSLGLAWLLFQPLGSNSPA